MASSINAATAGAGGVITQADNSGILNLQSGGVTVATINSTGIVMASNTAPTFSAYQSSAQTLSSGTFTKINLQTEEWDTANCFDSTTNYRFTPTIAGYYQVSGAIEVQTTATPITPVIYKNGSAYKKGGGGGLSSVAIGAISALVYLNGSTDYVELYAAIATGQALVAAVQSTYFQACFVRSA